jgi:hypothetical protein
VPTPNLSFVQPGATAATKTFRESVQDLSQLFVDKTTWRIAPIFVPFSRRNRRKYLLPPKNMNIPR